MFHLESPAAATPSAAGVLLTRLQRFCLPAGEDAVRGVVRAVNTQRGTLRGAPRARAMSFEANEVISATESYFRWDARMSGRRIVSVTDAYEKGAGRLVVRVGGIPIRRGTGPAYDRGELQRYLALVGVCPAMIVNHPFLSWSAVGPSTLRLSDGSAPAVTVDVELDEYGAPIAVHALRPREAGRTTELTPWTATCHEFVTREGMRVPTVMEAMWHLPEGAFTYVTMRLTSLHFERRPVNPS